MTFLQVAWLMKATSGLMLDFFLQDLIEMGCLFQVLPHIDFRKVLRNCGFPSAALVVYKASDKSSFNLVDFLSNCSLLAGFCRLELINEHSYYENDWFEQFYRVGEPEVPELGKRIKVRKLVSSPDPSLADKILKLALDDLPVGLEDFYCSINSIAFASVRHKRLDLLIFSAKLILQKFLAISPRPSDSVEWFKGESYRALFQASVLTTHLLKALSRSSASGVKDFTVEDLDDAIPVQSLVVLHQWWTGQSPFEAVGLLTDCSQFYTE